MTISDFNSKEQSPSWEANRSSVKKFTTFYGGSSQHSQQPATCFYPQTNPVHAPSHFLKIHFNIILPFTSRYFKWFPSLRFPHQNPVCTSPVSPFYPPCFDPPNNIWWGVQIVNLLIMYSSPLPCYLPPLRSTYPPQQPILEHLQPTLLP